MTIPNEPDPLATTIRAYHARILLDTLAEGGEVNDQVLAIHCAHVGAHLARRDLIRILDELSRVGLVDLRHAGGYTIAILTEDGTEVQRGVQPIDWIRPPLRRD